MDREEVDLSIATPINDGPTLDRLLDPVCDVLTPEAARKIVDLRMDPQMQQLIDDFADRHHEGRLSVDELAYYERLVQTIDFISLFQAKARNILNRTKA